MENKKQIRKRLLEQEDLTSKNIAILSGSTIGEIQIALEVELLQQGIRPAFWVGDYNRWYEDALFENQSLTEFEPDIIYIHTTNKNIVEFPSPKDEPDQVDSKLKETYQKFECAWEELKKKHHCPMIQNNFEYLPYRVMGNADAYRYNGSVCFVNRLNQKMCEYARANSNFYINDINYQASWYGLEKWSNLQQWYLYKYALDIEAIPLLCVNVANMIKSLYGRNKKALALDLDNTLWGGVVGDDGVENIKLGIEMPEGMAYVDFQKYIKSISELGVALNICSKNEEENALKGLAHPASVLHKEDFIKIKANWNDKHSNLKEIAKELNIGMDSVVFVDDNPAEREIIRKFLPSVAIPELEEPESYIQTVDCAGYFEVTNFTEDDGKRNEFYKANQQRESEAENYQNYEEYLTELNMQSSIESFNDRNISRVTQLINKTNQFNFTTRRYTLTEIETIKENENCITIQANLMDKFGDNGIVTALIGTINGQCISIDLWVMSCRVFKRNLEYAVFDQLVKQCKQRNIQTMVGKYIRSKKNALIENFYEELGFQMVNREDDITVWEYRIPVAYVNKNRVIGVIENESR